ncbi:MAG: 4-oxalocrotonate decarboxylase, partial [Gammaproteobacteria bacterium]|nr:4-oxalocrotonate decarboxylase [Gammaproteobacteria bacterium]
SNLVACNIASDRYIVGEQQPLRDSYGDIQITLTRDGEEVCSAPASDALGGPQAALAWMLNEARDRGLEVEDGMLLITGACGGIHPAQPGSYVADYGDFGRIEFTVT